MYGTVFLTCSDVIVHQRMGCRLFLLHTVLLFTCYEYSAFLDWLVGCLQLLRIITGLTDGHDETKLLQSPVSRPQPHVAALLSRIFTPHKPAFVLVELNGSIPKVCHVSPVYVTRFFDISHFVLIFGVSNEKVAFVFYSNIFTSRHLNVRLS